MSSIQLRSAIDPCAVIVSSNLSLEALIAQVKVAFERYEDETGVVQIWLRLARVASIDRYLIAPSVLGPTQPLSNSAELHS